MVLSSPTHYTLYTLYTIHTIYHPTAKSPAGAAIPTLEEVTNTFEEIYQGTDTTPGLCDTETLICSKGFLKEIYRRCNGKLAVVTGM